MESEVQPSLDFLFWVKPSGPWTLTAIPLEGGRTTTETFDGSSVEGLREWLKEFNGKQNLYWTVNTLFGPVKSKPKKEDVSAMDWLHVDIDPVKGRDLDQERASILLRLRAFKPAPSLIIDSGGGYQGFWKLDEPLHVGGDLIRAADVEAYNQQLGILLGGDATHNVDRIMRLPGTWNLPNDKKKAAGRIRRLAAVVDQSDAVHPLHEFVAAPRAQTGTSNGTTQAAVKISGNLQTILIDDLPELVTQRTRMLIVQGGDPDDPTRYGSSSEVVFAVCCEMIRAGCDDDTIAAVLLDPDYEVSTHVRKQRRSVEYAARQIQRAREHVVEPMLATLNAKHAVIADMGGKCRVISEVYDPALRRLRISKQSFEDFRNRYMHQRVQVGKDKDGQPLYKQVGHWWLLHAMRRQYTSLVFSPGHEVEDAYNLWRGFFCEAVPGQGHELYLEHIRENICRGNEAHYHYLIRWMARAVQQPGEPGQIAVVLRGGQGTGKGTFAHVFGSVWGRHYLQVSNAKHLVGQFNAHLRDCVLLFADEAFFAGDKSHEGILNTIITEDLLLVESKGVDAEVTANTTHLIMGSNAHWVVPAGADARRYLVLDVGEDKKQNTAYFARITAAINNGGRESLLHYLLTLDISDFNVRDVPQTEALRDQKMYSFSVEEAWWMERLMDGRTTHTCADWQQSIMKDRLHADMVRYAEGQRMFRRVSPTVLGKFLGRIMPDGWPKSVQRTANVDRPDREGRLQTTRERVYFYDLPPLDTCRAIWDSRYGGPYQWPTEEAALPDMGRPDPY